MQYIQHYTNVKTVQYVIKKETPASIIGLQLKPEYYGAYLKNTFGITEENFCTKISLLPKENYIPEISFILNQIRNFSGTEASAKLFLKAKLMKSPPFFYEEPKTYKKRNTPFFQPTMQLLCKRLSS